MKVYLSTIVRALLFLSIILLLAGFQTTLWYQIFGDFPAPMLWLIPCLYLSLYRNHIEALFLDCAVAFCVAPFTVMPISTLIMILFALTAAAAILKHHLYWRGSRVFASFVFLSIIGFQALYFFLSWFLEDRAVLEATILGRAGELGLSYLVAYPIYYLCLIVDDLVAPAKELELHT